MNPSALADDDLGEGDERGDAGGKNDEEQSYNHLIGGFWIVFLPVADQGPAAADVHDAEADESNYGGDGRDELRHILNISEQGLNGGTQIHECGSLRNGRTHRDEGTCAVTVRRLRIWQRVYVVGSVGTRLLHPDTFSA